MLVLGTHPEKTEATIKPTIVLLCSAYIFYEQKLRNYSNNFLKENVASRQPVQQRIPAYLKHTVFWYFPYTLGYFYGFQVLKCQNSVMPSTSSVVIFNGD